MDSNSVSHTVPSHASNGHDHCWSSKSMDWHVKSPWDWEGMGLYTGDNRYERIPVAEWAGSEEGFGGKECFRMDVTAMSDQPSGMPGIGGSLSEVINDSQMEKNFSGNHRMQYTLEGKNHSPAIMEESVKSEGNGIKNWLDGTTHSSHGYLGSDYSATSNHRNMLVGLGGVNGYHSTEGFHRNNNNLIKDVQGDSLTCLKLGKRQYFEDNGNAAKAISVSFAVSSSVHKRPRPLPSSSSQPPRCQVEGCNVALTNAKEYHRRHKVCEMHSKAPKAIVVGLEQRFCQQCSRFHVISEFDDAKRSCRRRLAGHNERRRKNSSDALANSSAQEEKRLMGVLGERYPYSRFSMPCMSSSGRALSLLSSQQAWVNPGPASLCGDLSSRSSAALRELIAENRAQGLFRYNSDDLHRGSRLRVLQEEEEDPHHHHQLQQEVGNCRYMPGLRSLENHVKVAFDGDELKKHGGVVGNNVVVRPTLDLMQNSNSYFALQSGRNKTSSSSSSSEQEECEIWKSFEGTQIV
eukprot:Gb_26599 [translate_table: standard]